MHNIESSTKSTNLTTLYNKQVCASVVWSNV